MRETERQWRRTDTQTVRRQARVTLPDGKTKAFYAKIRAEVAERLATALHEIKQGVPQPDGKQTFGHYMNIWFPTTKAHIRQSTYRRYGDYVRVHIVPGLGKHTLAKLNAQHLQLYYARKIDEGLSSTTVHHIHGVIHRALEDAQRMGLVQRNVSEMVKAPRRSHREMRTLSPEEVRRFLDEVHGDRWEAL
jgi:integrase